MTKVDLVDLKQYSLRLFREIERSGYEPQHVLYIERAGLFIAHEIANHFECTISGIYANRSGTTLKSKVKIILRYLPKNVTDILRNMEERSGIHGAMKERRVYVERNHPPKGKNILIVDDAVDTGNSLMAVINFLVSKGYNEQQIKTAVLTTTRNTSQYRADMSLYDHMSFAFPWSYTSKEYNQAWELYKALKGSIVSQEWEQTRTNPGSLPFLTST